MSVPDPAGGPQTRLLQRAGSAVADARDAIARHLVEEEFLAHPELVHRYGAQGRAKSIEDAGYHLRYLAEALASENAQFFVDYVGWAKIMLAKRGVWAEDFLFHLQCMKDAIPEYVAPDLASEATRIIADALAGFSTLAEDVETFIDPSKPHAALANHYVQSLLRGERQHASRLILESVANGIGVRDIYLYVFQPSQYEIGRLWQTNQISVAQEHYCTAATQLIMSQLYPYIFATEKSGGRLVATCVSGDLHELGVRMVADFFEMAGWDTYFLGANTPITAVVQAVIERKATVLGISATMTYHVRTVAEMIAAVRASPACAGVRILVGGFPFNLDPELWRKVGADGHAPDADAAIALAQRLTEPGPTQ